MTFKAILTPECVDTKKGCQNRDQEHRLPLEANFRSKKIFRPFWVSVFGLCSEVNLLKPYVSCLPKPPLDGKTSNNATCHVEKPLYYSSRCIWEKWRNTKLEKMSLFSVWTDDILVERAVRGRQTSTMFFQVFCGHPGLWQA